MLPLRSRVPRLLFNDNLAPDTRFIKRGQPLTRSVIWLRLRSSLNDNIAPIRFSCKPVNSAHLKAELTRARS